MAIKLADVLKYLNSSRGIVAKVAKDTGIKQDNLHKWSKQRGKPAGDEMLILVDYVAAHSKLDEKQNYHPLHSAVKDVAKKLSELNETLKGIEVNLKIDDGGTVGNPPPDHKLDTLDIEHSEPPEEEVKTSDKLMKDAALNEEQLRKKRQAAKDQKGSSKKKT